MPQSKKDCSFSAIMQIPSQMYFSGAAGVNELCGCLAHQGSDQCFPQMSHCDSHTDLTNTNTLHVCRQMLQMRSSCLLISAHIRREGKKQPLRTRPQTIARRHISSPDDSPYFSTQGWYPRLSLSPTWAACPGNNLVSAQHSRQN